jgi:RND family efflux transporter MFP subunit
VSSANPFDPQGASSPEGSSAGNFIYLDRALWQQFRDAQTPEEFTSAWLALQCRVIGGAVRGIVVLGEPDVGPFAPAAFWPGKDSHSPELAAIAERAMAERRAAVSAQVAETGESPVAHVAHPLILDNRLLGVVAISVDASVTNPRDVLRHLQWGEGWIELLWRREQAGDDAEQRERTNIAFDMLAAVLEQQRFAAACKAVVTELAVRLDCDQVSIGFVDDGRAAVAEVSHASGFGDRMNLIRDIGAAMDEAIDQEAIVLYPVRENWDYRVTRVHEVLATAHQIGVILTVPLHTGGEVFGALCFERLPGEDFDEQTIELCDAVASVIGPMLAEKKENDRHVLLKLRDSIVEQTRRFLGPEYFGRKMTAAVIGVVVLFFSMMPGDYRVTSPAVLEGLVQRTIAAPFQGYIASQEARAGEIVKEGQVLATLDDRDLALERLRWSTTHRQRLAEYDRALAARERAEANIARAQIDQAIAQIAMLDEQLVRTRVVAPFDGVIVAGDLSQSVGTTVDRGEELFKIAPLEAYRIILEVDEADIADIRRGQTGRLRITSVPDEQLTYTVERVTPLAEQADGRNYFRVEATLEQSSEAIRPGMGGIAKTDVDERLLIRIWTDKIFDWIRLALWKWLP